MWFHIRNISHIRKYLDQASTETLVHAFITSKLDNLNSLLFGLPEYQIEKLQKIQNAAAKLILRKKKFDHVTPLLQELHWLPVKKRIVFKILLLTYKALNGMAPGYLKDLLKPKADQRLRSAANGELVVPRVRTKLGQRRFGVAAPRLWNQLPLYMRNAQSVEIFKKYLKTHLFRFDVI